MEILFKNSTTPTEVTLILGFFDGIHLGHQKVLERIDESKRVLVTFSSSPGEFFGDSFAYIYPRKYNYKIIETLGIDYLLELDFSEISKLTALEYLEFLKQKFKPKYIKTGFNHTFGVNRQGNSKYLESNQTNFQYKCVEPYKLNNAIVSSSLIKNFLSEGKIENANQLLGRNFSLQSEVIEGAKIGRKIGFPTANMIYPKNIIKIPYGVYKVKVGNMPAIMNWGIKPTIGSDELLEVHIPNYNENLYGKELDVQIISKIRNEKKFINLEELKKQIEKDVKECLK